MKKSFKIQNVDCANCAATMESRIRKLDGVSDARVNFLTGRFTLDADDARFEALVEASEEICKRVDSHVAIAR